MIGVYAGSFDPVTRGHLWVIKKAVDVVGENGKLIIAIAKNADKKSFFTFDERVSLLVSTLSKALPYESFGKCEVMAVENEYLVKFAEKQNANFIFRGIRNAKDFDYEVGIQQVNRDLSPDIETIFFLPPPDIIGISSSIVKGMVGFEDWKKAVGKYVPSHVVDALEKKIT